MSATPTEKISLLLSLSYFVADQENRTNTFGPGGFNFNNNNNSDELGWELGLYADYQYSEDLVLRTGYAHFFGGDGLGNGNFVTNNGLGQTFYTQRRGLFSPFRNNNNGNDADYNYLFWEAEISF